MPPGYIGEKYSLVVSETESGPVSKASSEPTSENEYVPAICNILGNFDVNKLPCMESE